MDQLGEGVMGGQVGFPLETWFWEMPLCTRWWTTATVLTSALVQCQIVTPFQLFYSFRTVFYKNQVRQPHIPSPCISNPYYSTGASSPPSSISALCRSIWYSMSSSLRDIQDYSKNRQEGHRRISPGCCFMRQHA
jgi:hypothetical protein